MRNIRDGVAGDVSQQPSSAPGRVTGPNPLPRSRHPRDRGSSCLIRDDHDAQACVRFHRLEKRLELGQGVDHVRGESHVSVRRVREGRGLAQVDNVHVGKLPLQVQQATRMTWDGSMAMTRRTRTLSGTTNRPASAPTSSHTWSGRVSARTCSHSSISSVPEPEGVARARQNSSPLWNCSVSRIVCSRWARTSPA